MTLIEKILSRDEFIDRPPVLLDIGAAGPMHPKWRQLAHGVFAAEFEPGILGAYQMEDKLWSLLAFMEAKLFWMADIAIRGTQRFNREALVGHLSALQRQLLRSAGKVAPGRGEVTYLNCFVPGADYLDLRDYLLVWVFATVEKQLGFALELVVSGHGSFADPLFLELKQRALRQIGGLIALWPVQKVAAMLRRLAVRTGLGI